MRSSSPRLVALAAIVLLHLGCHYDMHVVAPSPSPNVIGKKKFSGDIKIDVSGVPVQAMCSTVANATLCVEGFRKSFGDGLATLLPQYVTPGPSPLHAEMRAVELILSTPAQGTGTLALRWQFVLRDGEGHDLAAVAATTTGPKNLTGPADAEEAVAALVNLTLEQIAQALDNASVPAAQPVPPT